MENTCAEMFFLPPISSTYFEKLSGVFSLFFPSDSKELRFPPPPFLVAPDK